MSVNKICGEGFSCQVEDRRMVTRIQKPYLALTKTSKTFFILFFPPSASPESIERTSTIERRSRPYRASFIGVFVDDRGSPERDRRRDLSVSEGCGRFFAAAALRLPPARGLAHPHPLPPFARAVVAVVLIKSSQDRCIENLRRPTPCSGPRLVSCPVA